MIYRVILDSGYRVFFFDFRDADSACAFIIKAAESYNKRDSDKMKISLEVSTLEEYNSSILIDKEEEE